MQCPTGSRAREIHNFSYCNWAVARCCRKSSDLPFPPRIKAFFLIINAGINTQK